MSKPIELVLRELEGGRLHGDVSDLVAECVASVIEHRKVGEVTLKLKFSPNGDNNVFVDTTLASKIPSKTRQRTMFYVTSGGDLVRDDPNQLKMKLEAVDGGKPAEVSLPQAEERRLVGSVPTVA